MAGDGSQFDPLARVGRALERMGKAPCELRLEHAGKIVAMWDHAGGRNEDLAAEVYELACETAEALETDVLCMVVGYARVPEGAVPRCLGSVPLRIKRGHKKEDEPALERALKMQLEHNAALVTLVRETVKTSIAGMAQLQATTNATLQVLTERVRATQDERDAADAAARQARTERDAAVALAEEGISAAKQANGVDKITRLLRVVEGTTEAKERGKLRAQLVARVAELPEGSAERAAAQEQLARLDATPGSTPEPKLSEALQ
jgi:hypothetical protein